MVRRLGPLGLVAAAVGSYALKRHFDKHESARPGILQPRSGSAF
jgi:hypothetical protein